LKWHRAIPYLHIVYSPTLTIAAERIVLDLFLVFLLLFAALTVLFWTGTLFFQGYIYSEPVDQVYWRAPAAGLALTVILAFWSFLDYRSPRWYAAPLDFTATEREDLPKFWSVKQGREIPYVGKPTPPRGLLQYYDPRGDLWKRSDTEGVVEAILVEGRDGQKTRFEADLTKDGKFKTEKGDAVRYIEVGGRHRVMEDISIGRITTTRSGLVLGYLFLNLVHLGVWFAALWLILRFQWGHALGFGVVLWLMMSLTIMPMLLGRVEKVAQQRALQGPASTTTVP
jgi:hypothetical protein